MARTFLHLATSAIFLIGTYPEIAWSQPVPAPQAPVSTAPPAGNTVEAFTDEQLDAMLAQIALYPDELLTQTLMATTNPTDIVSASRWLAEGNHKSLKGKPLEDALKAKPWDPSVKSLVQFPQVLETLDKHLDWTQQIGYAMEVQQPDVLNSVQRLRGKAVDAGNLKTNEQIRVSTEPTPAPPQGQAVPEGTPTHTIVVEPANPAQRAVHSTGTGDVLSICMILLEANDGMSIRQKLRISNRVVREFMEGRLDLIPSL